MYSVHTANAKEFFLYKKITSLILIIFYYGQRAKSGRVSSSLWLYAKQ